MSTPSHPKRPPQREPVKKRAKKSTKKKTQRQARPKQRQHQPASQVDYVNLKAALDHLRAHVDSDARVAADPIRFPKRFSNPQDQEVISLFAALLAYGRVSAIGNALEDVLQRIGPNPAIASITDASAWRDHKITPVRFEGFIYRFTRGVDLHKLWLGVGGVLLEHQSLGDVLRSSLTLNDSTLMSAYQGLYEHIQHHSEGVIGGRGFAHLLSDPRRGSALKRVNMWLRWMVRGPDLVDLGLWRDLGPERLILPLDVHTFRLSRALGLTTRRTPDLKAALEITQHLSVLAPTDPISYDFALAHLGISGACKGRRITEVCQGCPLNTLCTLS